MEKGTQPLLGNYASIYERPKTNTANIQMKKQTEQATISTRNHYLKTIEKERERTRVDYHNNKYRLNYCFLTTICIVILNIRHHILYTETSAK